MIMEEVLERVDEYNAISIKLTSSEEIRSWSCGEVKKPETINYRTLRPEKDGLFCEKIFGPERDWECSCGKYKGVKYKGLVCDRCGVQITRSYERRRRMGHINLACPVGHIWFFKTIPSRMGAILDMKINQLERVIYHQDYVVTKVMDPKCDLKERQLLNEDEYRKIRDKYRDCFEADMGASALKTLLQKIDFRELSVQLRSQLSKITSEQKYKEIVKRLIIIEKLVESANRPEWMILSCVPVIPPDLRPLVMLESGVFATSDLNDLYRRLINRNNRLKKLIDLNAPEVIIRNEKRMLQQAVDALFDNSRCRRPVLASNNRPLKSLADIIKGKQGRFRENLLGKRVDYSARSVIVVGPELKLHQCGIPKRIALELYQPFVVKRLKDVGIVDSLRSAKKVIERKDEVVWDILDEVMKDHPVLLNRAPTLHRMGIESFYPALVEGNAIHLHPLVCPPFNADFDGDQMAVHLPLSFEALIEAKTLIMAINNIFSPAHGRPIITPTQDIILGLAYLTTACEKVQGEGKVFSSTQEAILAYEMDKINIHAVIEVKMPIGKQVMSKHGKEHGKHNRYKTTVGRILFNEILPDEVPYYNYELDKKEVGRILSESFQLCGKDVLVKLLDEMKRLGFKIATLAGLSFSKDDLKIPPEKQRIIKNASEQVEKIERDYKKGSITSGERYSQIVDVWISAREQVAEKMIESLKNDVRDGRPYLNPIFLMVASGARGSHDQIRQLAGMRGLMAKPSGKIIETPIISNFREGLSILEYFSSTHGARKGLADTALKTADAGYLTRKLVDVAQNCIISMHDCGTLRGITKNPIYRGNKLELPLWQAIYGRSARQTITDIVTDEIIVREDELITEEIAKRIEVLGYSKLMVRSPLTCDAPFGLCALCYGMDLSTGKLVEEGLAVGIIAAQSIGEPGTQLTMRTFHIGGMAIKATEEPRLYARTKGIVRYVNVKTAVDKASQPVVINRDAEINIVDDKDRKLEEYQIPVGSTMKVKEAEHVKPGAVLAEWDAHNIPIIAGNDGHVVFEDILKGKTMQEEKDPKSEVIRRVIIEHRGDLHPQIVINDSKGTILEFHPIPERAHLEISDGEHIKAGSILAKTPREITGTQDITGGLPRITELFEARSPKDPAVVSRIDGVVELGEKKRGRRVIIVKNPETGVVVSHEVPYGRHLRVRTGDKVKAGDPLVEGPLVPKEILRIKGEEDIQQYLLNETQVVYRTQNVTINDKHIEIIISQMMRKVRIQNPGDSKFLKGAIVDRYRVRVENERLKKNNKKPATFEPLLLGVTKAAIQSESFISAASFQETTRVLADAAISGKRDELLGLKENVIIGHLIPAGSGYKKYIKQQIRHEKLEDEEEEEVAA